MVNARICEACFFASLRLFNFLDGETETPKCLSATREVRARDVQISKDPDLVES